MSTTPPCYNAKCSNPGPQRCSKCKGLRFCGRDCQLTVWNSHKALCNVVAKEPDATCLLLDGMGPLGPDGFYAQRVKTALASAGVKVVTVNVCNGSKLPEQVGSILAEVDRFSSCIILGWGSTGGTPIENEFGASRVFREKIVAWVEKGGKFIVQGENVQLYGNWPQWFGKPWMSNDYRRTDYLCNAKNDNDIHWCKWYHKARGALTDSFDNGKRQCYNAKAAMLDGVASEDILFGTTSESKSYSHVPFMAGLDLKEGLCAIALGKFGDGSVSFFGDVNAEEDTCTIMAVISRGS